MGFSSFRKNVGTKVVAGSGGFVAVALSWAMGLFDARSAPPPPPLPKDSAVAAGIWSITPGRLNVSGTLPDGRLVPPGRRALILDATLVNRTGETRNDYAELVRLAKPPPGLDATPRLYLVRDRALLEQLHPGLAEDVRFVWTYPADAGVPTSVRFEIIGRNFKPRDNLYDAPGWFNPASVGTVELPVSADVPAPFGSDMTP